MNLRMEKGGDVTMGSTMGHGIVTVGTNGWDAPSLPSEMVHRGNLRLLDEPLTALFCSSRCPGDLVLKTYDLARAMREAGVPVIGGFQTPMERECLRLLLRGEQPVVVCPARGIGNMRVPREWRPALDDGRLLVLSSFPSTIRRPTAEFAAQRNDLVANLAQRVFIAHAAPGGKTEAFARKLAASGKPLLTLDSPANANLVGMGARVVVVDSLTALRDIRATLMADTRQGKHALKPEPCQPEQFETNISVEVSKLTQWRHGQPGVLRNGKDRT